MERVTWETLWPMVAAGVVMVPIIQGIVNALKPAFKKSVKSNFWPAITLLVGVLLGLFVGFIIGQWWPISVLVGGVAGLGAAKLYDYGGTQAPRE